MYTVFKYTLYLLVYVCLFVSLYVLVSVSCVCVCISIYVCVCVFISVYLFQEWKIFHPESSLPQNVSKWNAVPGKHCKNCQGWYPF